MKKRSPVFNFLVIILELAVLAGCAYLLIQNILIFKTETITESNQRTLALFFVLLVGINLATRLVKWWYRQRGYSRRRGVKNFVFGVENIRKLLLVALGIFTFFSLLGVEFSSLFTSLSIVAAAIAIISKEFVNDLIVGMYYSFSDTFEAGDYVKFHGYKGRVVDIGLLKVKIMNDNDDLVILPNGKVYSEEIINYTRRDVRLMSIDFEMDIKLVRQIDALEKELINAVSEYAEHIEPRSYNLKIREVKKDLLELKFQYRLIQEASEVRQKIKRSTVRAVFSYVTTHQQQPEA
ncbi:mechanosensitive ion channel [Neolewinella aurantiaca]|uniref:Mechanosensitive ion channel n=1 Tax=Neolewinella aurantiaca TaxID=2602767 RepID=A0A5C7FDR2_9BACT|nr:mechanosensitive ion channel domain-containing protein [Neolewinella aurantiaca]TXF87620.1 mechanosensitive ion channel [Neolewinella aurantiaca]